MKNRRLKKVFVIRWLYSESLMSTNAGLYHRQRQLAHTINSTQFSQNGGAAPMEKCVEGDALMAREILLQLLSNTASQRRAGSGKASAALKQLQRTALVKAKAQKRKKESQTESG